MASGLFQHALIYLGTAIVFVPISKKLGIGSVLGYLIGGILVGPFALGLIGTEGHDVMHTAEFGVVMMLFIIGLELNPAQFWKMRAKIVGLGGLQMLLTAVLLFMFLYLALSFSFKASLALALSFAMSSTAIVLQTLKEKLLDKTPAGQHAFSVLLFQDIAVIPILAVLPLLALQSAGGDTPAHRLPPFLSFLDQYPSLLLLAAVGFVFILSRYLLPLVLRVIAKVQMRELFTAAALFFVIGIAWLMESVGISAALGAFMAGVLLANSEFRHELEADINPFKGLLLGVFFTAVGSTINFAVIAADPARVFSIVLILMTVKWIVLYFLGRRFRLVADQQLLFAFLLCQVGEFAFVLLASIAQLGIVPKQELDLFMAVVTISMMVSPLLLFVYERFVAPRFTNDKKTPVAYDAMEAAHHVILVGFGHFGSTIGRFLRANNTHATIIDSDSERVNLLRKMGFKVFYGDGTRLDLLESAGASDAQILISAIDDPHTNMELSELLPKHFPNLKLFVRAKNRYDAYELMDKGITHVHRESLIDSVYMGVDILSELGHRKYTLHRKAQDFIKYDNEALEKLYRHRKSDGYISRLRAETELQERLLQEDKQFLAKAEDSAWDSSHRN
ncbi:monovalent cation:proton antiporter-2 (CPA2) family protein [Sphingobacterium griseoflavum]|uniref:Potassium transporter n=1 Tax=Sphingobacterium griseoflavum TaxID=1474952 RepID=A0ABQ3HYJ0_9SPHI|nr:monovalent cation:proton antiporter-2 (CPA2) family protein [Sphingobacterium griseoflavum]GHE32037.1 potassium transporter [Sphingobacterium griseoflavum]